MSPAGRAAGARTAVRSTELAYEHPLELVMRPDSGEPSAIVLKTLQSLDAAYATSRRSR